MAEKYQYIEELAGKALKDLTKRDNWINYLKTASNHYKYSFRDSLLIYAQKPEAAAVASFDLWNNVMHRYINKGAKGIALIDRKSNKPELHYVFDISDTHGEQIPYIWRIKEEYIDRINQELKDSFEVEGDLGNFDSIIGIAVASILEDNLPELISELKYSKENSFLEEFDDQNLEVVLKNTLYESVIATVFLRCGYEIDIEDNLSYEFSQLYNFNTPDTMILLGTAVSDISETILREIEISVKTIEKEQRNQERIINYGSELQRNERPDVPGHENQGADRRTTDEIRNNAEESSGTELSGEIQPNDTRREPVYSLQGDRNTDENPDEFTGRSNEEDNRTEPLADKDSGDRERTDSGDDTHEITDQDDIDVVLLDGSGYSEGKQRIIDYFFEHSSNSERAAFLKDEYGIGGGTVYFSKDRTGFQNHNSKGIDIFQKGFGDEPIKLTWSNAAKRIGELIESGQYYVVREEFDKLLSKPEIDANLEEQGADEAPLSMEENKPKQEAAEQSPAKRRTQSEMNFARLKAIVPHIMDKRYRYAKLTSAGFMDLTVEWIGENRIAIAHFGEQNGDMMADPDMELIVDFDKDEVLPATYQNDYAGIYQEVYSENSQWNPKLSRELTSFLNTWLRNIELQGHVISKAIYYDNDMESIPILLNEQGQEFGFDIPHDFLSMSKLNELETGKEETSTSNEMKEYGYKWEGMLQIDEEVALKLFDAGHEIYLLHDDNTEALAESEKRLIQHITNGGLVGIEKELSYLLENELPEQNVVESLLVETRLYEGMDIEYNGRKYRVSKIDSENDNLQLEDITFAQGVGFPIFRQEHVSSFEKELEESGFFNKRESEEPQHEKINFHITDDNLGVGGTKEKYQRNVAAIKLLKQVENENRLATTEEQEVLAQYVGWGGLSKVFDEMDSSWSHEYSELKGLLDEGEYKAARSSVLTAYYTPPIIIRAMYNALENMGFKGGNVLEPAMGIGNFVGLLPPSLSDSKMYGVELDSISGRIAKQLYQRENIQVTGLEHTAFHDNFFDVAIGNIPFGSYGISDKKYDKHNFMIHDYFFAKVLDKVRPGGIVAFITSKGTLDKKKQQR